MGAPLDVAWFKALFPDEVEAVARHNLYASRVEWANQKAVAEE